MSFDASFPSPIHGIADTSWPTMKQLAAIGSVVASWTWLELVIEETLSTLVQSSDVMLSQALTEDLGADYRIKATKRLVTTWQRMFPKLDPLQASALDTVADVVKWVSQNKVRRNQTVHWLWIRQTDEEMYGWKHHQAPIRVSEVRGGTTTVTELLLFSEEAGKQGSRLAQAELTLRQLPKWKRHWKDDFGIPALASLLGPYTSRDLD